MRQDELVYDHLLEHDPCTASDVARALGISVSRASTVLEGLVRADAVSSSPGRVSGRGRPARRYCAVGALPPPPPTAWLVVVHGLVLHRSVIQATAERMARRHGGTVVPWMGSRADLPGLGSVAP